MRKKIIDQDLRNNSADEGNWLDIERLAQVEISSEHPEFPIEGALKGTTKTGWKASEPGRQTIRFIFDEPQNIRQIHLLFTETQQARTQEFVLRWSPADDSSLQEIVRQQYNFSPGSSTKEEENYTVNLSGVKVLELNLIPDINGGNGTASLTRFRIA